MSLFHNNLRKRKLRILMKGYKSFEEFLSQTPYLSKPLYSREGNLSPERRN